MSSSLILLCSSHIDIPLDSLILQFDVDNFFFSFFVFSSYSPLIFLNFWPPTIGVQFVIHPGLFITLIFFFNFFCFSVLKLHFLCILSILIFIMPFILQIIVPIPLEFNPITFIIGGIVPILLALFYPYISWKNKESDINGKMHFFITHLRVLAISDLSLKDIIIET